MKEPEEFTSEDAEIAELLRNVGARDEPAPKMMQEVEAAVRAEWLESVAARRRRRTFVWAAAASICALSVGTVVSVRLMGDAGQRIATLQRAEGDIFVSSEGSDWARVSAGRRVAIGDSIRADARAALNLDSGISLRIDGGTSFEVTDDDRLALNKGAVYVDSGLGGDIQSLTINTHAGSVRHIGTQYQVRMRVDGIDVSVREGRVVIDSESGSNVATAGEHLTISTQGSVLRGRISPTDEQWRWASEIAPAFVIENASLLAFLDWVARETGRELVFESARAESVAASEILHGSIEGLAPEVAIRAVLTSTPLRQRETTSEAIEIGLATSIDSRQAPRPTP